MQRQTDLRYLVREGVGPAHKLPRNASNVPGLSILPAGHTGTPCASMLRQEVRGVIHKSPGRPHLEATLHAGERPSCVGSKQSALTEGDACARQVEPWSRHVAKEQHLLRGMNASSERNLQKIWEVCGRARVDLFASEDNSHCQSFSQRAWMPWPTIGPAFRSLLSFQLLCYRRYSGESGSNGTNSF